MHVLGDLALHPADHDGAEDSGAERGADRAGELRDRGDDAEVPAQGRVLDDEERNPRLWAAMLAASLGVGLLLKSLIAVVFPVGAGVVYLVLVGRAFDRQTWRRLRPFSGTLIVIAIAAPWYTWLA